MTLEFISVEQRRCRNRQEENTPCSELQQGTYTAATGIASMNLSTISQKRCSNRPIFASNGTQKEEEEKRVECMIKYSNEVPGKVVQKSSTQDSKGCLISKLFDQMHKRCTVIHLFDRKKTPRETTDSPAQPNVMMASLKEDPVTSRTVSEMIKMQLVHSNQI